MNAKYLTNPADTMELSNGVRIPCLGYGTWQTPDGLTAQKAVAAALRAGYRHIDAAAVYGNERSVGAGIAEAGVPHEELFVTGKLWNTERGYETTKAAFAKTLTDLDLDYLDLYLIHWPANRRQFGDEAELINRETWRAMTELYQEGKIRAIGVSNFLPHHLEQLMDTDVPPMVDQIEFHPGHLQEETVRFCRDHGILVEAWSPLGSGRVLGDERLAAVAARYGVSVAQLCIRYALQKCVLPLPKSVTPSRIVENADVFGFEIRRADMEAINALGEFGGAGLGPDEVDF